MIFNAIVLDMHPYVADEIFARDEGIFDKRLVAGSMVFSIGLGLMAHNNVIPSATVTTDCASSSRSSSAIPSTRCART